MLATILTGLSIGPGIVYGLLGLLIAALVRDRLDLLRKLDAASAKMDAVATDYMTGRVTSAEAIRDLTVVLTELKGRL
jgi:hypothetical protein